MISQISLGLKYTKVTVFFVQLLFFFSAAEMRVLGVLFLFSLILVLSHFSSYILCINSKKSLQKLCSHSASTCADSANNMHLQALNVSNPACASQLKSVLCAMCNQFSGEIHKWESSLRNVSVLCCSTILVKSSQSQDNASVELYKKVWDACEAFVRSLDNGELSFYDEAVSYNNIENTKPLDGMCLEKVGNGTFIDMAPHPDGSNRVFLSNQQGKVWLANVPDEESNGILEIVESKSFLDLTNEVAFSTWTGLMGMAFHPNFVHNGRFFISFNCDKMKQSGCLGRCSCNTDVDCDPAKLGADNGVQPCQHHSIVAEYTVNSTSSNPSLAKRANPAEVRRIFTMGLPHSSSHAGQILFGPADGYLYLMIADGSDGDDPYDFAQNKKSPLGKILRIDVDRIPSASEINELGLWGNYSIPKDNPYIGDKELEPEIWALGFNNAWRCSFDSERPSYFFCGESGKDLYEEVDIIIKGGNYGWPIYEGPLPSQPAESPRGNTYAASINPIFPVMGYYHSEIGAPVRSASVIGGYIYRSMTDPCMYGRYLYMDLYGRALWVGTENPENSGNFKTSRIPFRCAHNSPIPCSFLVGSDLPDLGYVFSFAQDNKKDIYILTSTGVYKVAPPSHCSLMCSKQVHTTSPSPHSSSPISQKCQSGGRIMGSFLSFLLLILDIAL